MQIAREDIKYFYIVIHSIQEDKSEENSTTTVIKCHDPITIRNALHKTHIVTESMQYFFWSSTGTQLKQQVSLSLHTLPVSTRLITAFENPWRT